MAVPSPYKKQPWRTKAVFYYPLTDKSGQMQQPQKYPNFHKEQTHTNGTAPGKPTTPTAPIL